MANNANNFKLTLDTLAPTGSITRPAQYIKDLNGNFTISNQKNSGYSGDDTASQMYVWIDTTATGSAPAGIDTATGWEAAASSKKLSTCIGAPTTEGSYYGHVIFRDALGNRSAVYNTAIMTYDKTAPEISSTSSTVNSTFDGASATDSVKGLQIYKEYDGGKVSYLRTNTRTIKADIYVKDTGGSGVDTVTFSGGATGTKTLTGGESVATGTYAGYTKYTVTIDLTTGDGTKTVSAVVTDKSGNASAAVSDTILLDTSAATAYLVLKGSDGSTTVPAYTNSNTFKISFTTNSNDIKYYSYYGDCTTTGHTTKTLAEANWIACDTSSATSSQAVTIVKSTADTFSSGDGNKTITLMIKDAAGNISTYTSDAVDGTSNTDTKGYRSTICYDNTKPTAALSVTGAGYKNASTGVYYVSTVSGYNVVTLSKTVDDATAGVKSSSIVNTTKSNAAITLDASNKFTATTTNLSEGANSLKLTVTDNANNSNTATTSVTLDTTAPTITMTAPTETWYKSATSVTITGTISDSGAGIKQYYIWASNTATATKALSAVPSGVSAVTPGNAASESLDTNLNSIYNTGLNNSATCYIHVLAVDNVGNVNHVTKLFKYDTTAPSVTSGSVSPKIVAKDTSGSYSGTITVTFKVGTDTSGASQYKLESSPAGITNTAYANLPALDASGNYVITTKINNTTGGYYTIKVYVKDAAGNESAAYTVASGNSTSGVEYDPSVPTGQIHFIHTNGSDSFAADAVIDGKDVYAKPCTVRISYTDDAIGGVSYKVYGDGVSLTEGGAAITESAAQWTTWTSSGGSATKDISLFLVANASGVDRASKDVYLKIKDNAGNVSTTTMKATVYLDESAPEVSIDNRYGGFDRISCTHVKRPGTTVTSDDQYADVVMFDFSVTDPYQAYKVCAYATKEAAQSGTHADTAIGTTNGSSGTSATGLNKTTITTVKINGKDFRAALGGSDSTNKDGLHYVVVYAQNLAGNWSQVKQYLGTASLSFRGDLA